MGRDRPNILLLLTDQQRFDSLGCNGAPVCKTPAVDLIAETGMRFTNAYTPIALCSPARGSLLTGLYPHNHGQLANMGNFNSVFDTQILGRPSYPSILSREGYRVGFVGKWHLPEEGNRSRWAFDRWHTDAAWHAWLRDQGIDFERGRDDVQRLEWGGDAPFCGRSVLPAEKTQEWWVADRTIDLLEAYSGEPFMICASFFGPHFPYAVPGPYDGYYDPRRVDRPQNFDEDFAGKPSVQQKEQLRWNASHLTWPDWQRVIAHYWGYCTFIDDQIGRILERLERLGLAEDTVVIFSADHGDMLGNHRLFNKGLHMYEETHHVPLIIRWPGAAEPGSVCDRFVNLVDLMPSILELGKAEVPDSVDGRSLVPLLSGDTPRDWPDDIFGEFHGYESTLCSIRMVRTDSWKYVYNPASEDELYDLRSDPGELRNVAGRPGFKHVLTRMKARLVAWLERTHDSIAEEDGWKGSSYDLFLSRRER